MDIDYSAIWEKMIDHFSLGDWSPHGPTHWKNVERNGVMLCKLNGADETVIRLFAVFHDAERENDGHDPDHGRRAAALAQMLRETDFSIDDLRMNLLTEALSYHNDGLTSECVTIGTCWDADRMDLPRVGITPRPDLMSTEHGKEFAVRGKLALLEPDD